MNRLRCIRYSLPLLFGLAWANSASAFEECQLRQLPFQNLSASVDMALGARVASDGVVKVRVEGSGVSRSMPVDVQPMYGAVRFSNGRSLLFKLSPSRPLTVVEAYSSAIGCADDRSASIYPRENGDILLGDGTSKSADHLGIRRRKGLTTVIFVRGEEDAAKAPVTRVLLITHSRIDAIGISLPNIEDSVRTLMTVSREPDGTLIIGRYNVQL